MKKEKKASSWAMRGSEYGSERGMGFLHTGNQRRTNLDGLKHRADGGTVYKPCECVQNIRGVNVIVIWDTLIASFNLRLI